MGMLFCKYDPNGNVTQHIKPGQGLEVARRGLKVGRQGFEVGCRNTKNEHTDDLLGEDQMLGRRSAVRRVPGTASASRARAGAMQVAALALGH